MTLNPSMILLSSNVEENLENEAKKPVNGGEEEFKVKKINGREFNYEKSKQRIINLNLREYEHKNVIDKEKYLSSNLDFDCKSLVKSFGALICFLIDNVVSNNNIQSDSISIQKIETLKL